MPAHAGIQVFRCKGEACPALAWIPTFAGMTE